MIDESVIKLALNLVFYDKTNHFEINVHIIREKFTYGIIKLFKIGYVNQIGNGLTKSLVSSRHENLYKKISLDNLFL